MTEDSEYAKATHICAVDTKVYVAGLVDCYSSANWIDDKMERTPSPGHFTGLFVK